MIDLTTYYFILNDEYIEIPDKWSTQVANDFDAFDHRTFLNKWYEHICDIPFYIEDFPWRTNEFVDENRLRIDIERHCVELNDAGKPYLFKYKGNTDFAFEFTIIDD
jgi:hypothetical protein